MRVYGAWIRIYIITFYVQKHIAPLAICSKPTLVGDKPHLWDYNLLEYTINAE